MTSVFKKGEKLTLLPAPAKHTELQSELSQMQPVIGVEMLLLYKKTDHNFSTPEAQLAIYNQLQAISTLSGIEYYSHTRKKIRTFIYNAYVIESQNKKAKVNDKKYTLIPQSDTLYAFMDDSSFGKYTGEVQYTFTDQHFTMKITNLVPIRYLLVPVVEPGNLKIYIALYPYADTILFYGFTCVNTINVFNMAEANVPSFTNRIKAMFAWFKSNL